MQLDGMSDSNIPGKNRQPKNQKKTESQKHPKKTAQKNEGDQ